MKRIHKNKERGVGAFPGIDARYSFSFARYYNPDRIGFGALRVCNNDVVAPAQGFPTHGHDNFEIITIPLRGAVYHKDSMGNEGRVEAGEVQTMSAGSGVEHSEMNANDDEEVEMLQIWIETAQRDIEPQYDQLDTATLDMKHGWATLASNKPGEGALINQDARIKRAIISKGETLNYELSEGRGLFVFVISGGVMANNLELFDRDSLELEGEDLLVTGEEGESDVLVIEVPMK